MSYNLNIGFSKKYYEREERNEEMIYKAQVIQSVYKCDKEETKNIEDHFDGIVYNKITSTNYYYYIDGLTIIINRRYDYVSRESIDNLEIQIDKKTVYSSNKNIYINGEWENTFESLFKKAFNEKKVKVNVLC